MGPTGMVSFQYVGILIPRYTTIKYNFLLLEKMIYPKNNWVYKNEQITKIPLTKTMGYYNEANRNGQHNSQNYIYQYSTHVFLEEK